MVAVYGIIASLACLSLCIVSIWIAADRPALLRCCLKFKVTPQPQQMEVLYYSGEEIIIIFNILQKLFGGYIPNYSTKK